MNAHHIIKRPLLTEKSTIAADEAKRFTFLVAADARKDEIKQAIEELYRVRVVSVNTINHQARNRRLRYGMVTGKITKKAVVRVHPDDTIELI